MIAVTIKLILTSLEGGSVKETDRQNVEGARGMESIKFTYGNHFSSVAKLLLYNSIKYRIILSLELLLFICCFVIAIWSDSNTLLYISFGVLATMLLNVVSQVVIIPNKMAKDPKFNQQIEMSCDSESIELRVAEAASKVKWNYFEKVWENNDYYLLFHNKKQYWIIPKGSIKDSEQHNLLRNHITKYHEIRSGIIR
jgi:hypothetical protein